MTTRSSVTKRFLAAVVAVLLCGLAAAENDTQSSGGKTVTSEENKDSLDKAVDPLYDMTNSFLELVQPESKGSYFEKHNITTIDQFVDDVLDDIPSFAKHYGGYMGCILVGLLFVLLMPLFGFIFCCCRCCCGNCGAHPGEPGKSDKMKRICCGLLLGVFATVMLASIVFAFITNDILRKQTDQDDQDAFLPQIQMSLSDLQDLTDTIILDIDSLPDKVSVRMTNLLEEIKDIPEDVKVKLGEITGAEDVIHRAEVLAESVSTINSSLTNIDVLTSQLVSDGSVLNTELSDLRTALTTTLSDPDCVSCDGIDPDQIQTEADYNKVDKVTAQLDNVTEIVEANITGLVQQGRRDFEGIANDVLREVTEQIDQAEDNVNSLVSDIRVETDEVTTNIRKVNFAKYNEDIDQYKDDVEKYGNYRFYTGIALGCIMLLVVLFYYMGLCFGALGEEPDDGVSCCNRGVGANLLMGGVAFSFIFSWLLMLVTIMLFLTGGLLHTELCRPVRDLENSSTAAYADQVLRQTLDFDESGYDIDISHILRTCKANGTAYMALNLENDSEFNITEIIFQKNEEIEREINELRDQQVDVGNTELVSSDTLEQLRMLRDTDLDKINFTSFKMQIGQDIVPTDFNAMADSLDMLAATQSDADIKQALQDHANTMRAIQADSINDMQHKEDLLEESLEQLETELKGSDAAKKFSQKVQDLIDELKTAEQKIQDDGDELVSESLDELADSLTSEISRLQTDLIHMVKYETGNCRGTYDSLSRAVDAMCVNLLDPYNGFWFSLGWCLFFFIPSIIVAIYLSTLYRKVLDYPSHKGLDEPPWWHSEQHQRLLGSRKANYF